MAQREPRVNESKPPPEADPVWHVQLREGLSTRRSSRSLRIGTVVTVDPIVPAPAGMITLLLKGLVA